MMLRCASLTGIRALCSELMVLETCSVVSGVADSMSPAISEDVLLRTTVAEMVLCCCDYILAVSPRLCTTT